MPGIISNLLNLMILVLWTTTWSVLENVIICALKKMCTVLSGMHYNHLSTSLGLIHHLRVLFPYWFSAWMICRLTRGVLSSRTIIGLLPISFLMFVYICFIFLGAHILGALITGLGQSLGEGNGNPLQYSCLENLRDRGTWWANAMGSQRVRRDLVTKQQ